MDPIQLRQVAQRKCPDILFCLSVAEDGSKAWVGSSDANVYEVDLTAKELKRDALAGDGHSSYVTGIARHGDTLVTCGYDKRIAWWDIGERRVIRSLVAHDKWIRGVAMTTDGTRVISIADDMRVRVWESSTGELVADLDGHAAMTPHHYPSMLYALAVSPDGQQFATGDRVGHVVVWNTETLQIARELESPKMYTWDPKQRRHSIGGVRSLAFSPDGTRLAVGGIGHIGNIDHLGGPSRIELFDLESGDPLLEIEDNKKQGLIEQIAWQQEGQWVLAAGGANNGFLSVFNAADGKLIHQVDHPGHIHAIHCNSHFESIHIAAHANLTHWTMS